MGFQEDLAFFGILSALINQEGAVALRKYLSDLRPDLPEEEADRLDEFLKLNCAFGSSATNSSCASFLTELSFDVLYDLIKKYARTADDTVDPQWEGWTGEELAPTEGPLQDVIRLYNLRQETLTAEETSMTADEFKEKWSAITDSVRRLRGSIEVQKYDELLEQCLQVTTVDQYLALITLLEFHCVHSVQEHLEAISEGEEDVVDGEEEVEDVIDGLALPRDVFDGNSCVKQMEMLTFQSSDLVVGSLADEERPKISKLKKVRKLGEGAFGKVYLYRDCSTKELFAVKQCGASTESEKFLRKEVNIFQYLLHERIVQFYSLRVVDKKLSIIMEYMENGSIYDRLKEFGAFNEKETLIYLKQILEGVHYLHSNYLIHRDIKGANVMLDMRYNAKLTDFGLSCRLRGAADTIRQKAGTMFWLAPEVARGAAYNTKADIWSIGCTVVEMLTTRPPYAGLHNAKMSSASLMRCISRAMPPVSSIVPTWTGQPLLDLLASMFIFRRDLRPSARELLLTETLQLIRS